jgi:uncharacterized phage protein (TIGR02220 family)
MAKYRPVHCSFWTDPRVLEEFTPEDKFFWLYLLTNEHTTQIGVYTITKKQMAFQMGYSPESINNLVARFENQYKLIRYNLETREIALKHWGRYNFIKGGKPIEDCVRKEIQFIKDISLLVYVAENIINNSVKIIVEEYLSSFLDEENAEEKHESGDSDNNLSCADLNDDIKSINENDNDTSTIRRQKEINKNKKNNNNNDNNKNDNNDDEKSSDKDTGFNNESIRGPNNKYSCESIIDYLNKKVGSNYNASDIDIISLIEDRIAEGYTYQDFFKVINVKVKDWIGTEYEKYLRPSTLFGDKFEKYLNQRSMIYIKNNIQNSKGIFSNRQQRNYDMDNIEKKLLGWDKY